jgi:glycosyltransferase involved in cell wall biosynthesis
MSDDLAITFVLPTLNETDSLRSTVEQILAGAKEHVQEILIVVCDRTEPASLCVARDLIETSPKPVRLYQQQLQGLGGALREAFEVSHGNHILLMASDLETDPKLIPQFIATMQEGRWDIVAASRWLEGGGFEGYGLLKQFLNRLFQLFLRVAYGTSLTDLTFAYRLYRRDILQGIEWTEIGHPFLLECLLRPLRRGARITEVPCVWQARREGSSANSFWQMMRYLKTALRIRFSPTKPGSIKSPELESPVRRRKQD